MYIMFSGSNQTPWTTLLTRCPKYVCKLDGYHSGSWVWELECKPPFRMCNSITFSVFKMSQYPWPHSCSLKSTGSYFQNFQKFIQIFYGNRTDIVSIKIPIIKTSNKSLFPTHPLLLPLYLRTQGPEPSLRNLGDSLLGIGFTCLPCEFIFIPHL